MGQHRSQITLHPTPQPSQRPQVKHLTEVHNALVVHRMIDVNYEPTRGDTGVAITRVADNDASTCNVLCVCSCVLRCHAGLNMSTKVCVLCVIVFGGVYLLTSKHLHDFGVAWKIEPTTTKFRTHLAFDLFLYQEATDEGGTTDEVLL